MTQLSDEILIAYVDGELGGEQVRVVNRVLAADAPTAARLRSLESSYQRLSRSFHSMLQAEMRDMAAEMAAEQALARQTELDSFAHTASSVPLQQQQPEQVIAEDLSDTARQPVQREGGGGKYLIPVVSGGAILAILGAVIGFMLAAGSAEDENRQQYAIERSGGIWNDKELERQKKRIKDIVGNSSEPRTTASTRSGDQKLVGKWFQRLAKLHLRQVDGLIEKLEGKSRNREVALFQLGNNSVALRAIPSLSEEEMMFAGADSFKLRGHNYVRLTYRDVTYGAAPVGLYVTAPKGGSLTLERGYEGDHNFVRWTQQDRSYLLIGKVPHWRLIVLSVAVQRKLVR